MACGGQPPRAPAGGSASTGDISTIKILASAELYDPKTGAFSPTASMTTARTDQTATLLSDGRVLMAGGYDRTTESLASAELYQP